VIVVDTSALMAIFESEPEETVFFDIILRADEALIAAPTRLEAFVVTTRRYGAEGGNAMETLIARLHLVAEPFDQAMLEVAQRAYQTYGRGRFGLNYGDCFSYALAKARDLPLLFKGDDFAATDVKRAV
jgi:ribonuclease VapC